MEASIMVPAAFPLIAEQKYKKTKTKKPETDRSGYES